MRHSDMFARNMTEMLLTYAIGHGVDHADMPYVRQILRQSAQADHRFSAIVLGVVKSAPFRMRRSES